MRGAGIGLLGLLIVAAITFYIMWGGNGGSQGGGYVRSELDAANMSHDFGNTISGKDSDGEIVTKSIKFEASNHGIAVNSVKANGAFDQKFGLRSGDVILEIGPLVAKDQAADNETADAYLRDAYARGEKLIVQRGGQRLTLPDDRTAAPVPVVNGAPTPTPLPPAQQPMNAKGSALDLVHKIETH